MISWICMSPCPDVGPAMRKKHTGGGCLSPKPHVSVLSLTCRELNLHMSSFAVTFVSFFLKKVSLKTFITGAKCLTFIFRNITDDQTQSMEKCSVCNGVFFRQVQFPKRNHIHPEESFCTT